MADSSYFLDAVRNEGYAIKIHAGVDGVEASISTIMPRTKIETKHKSVPEAFDWIVDYIKNNGKVIDGYLL